MKGNLLTYECAVKLGEALKQNTTLKTLLVRRIYNLLNNLKLEANVIIIFLYQLDENNLTSAGIYVILDSLNNNTSKLDFLSVKVIFSLKMFKNSLY